MKNIHFISLIIIAILEINLFQCYIVLPIETLPKENYMSEISDDGLNTLEAHISSELKSPIFTRIEIGTPGKTIPLLLKPKSNDFLFTSINPLDNAKIQYNKTFYDFSKDLAIFFDEKKSKSFITEGEWVINAITNTNVPVAEGTSPCTETFSFYNNIDMKTENKIKKEKLKFTLAKNVKDDITGLIGLNIFEENANKEKPNSFLNVLQSEKLIDDYHWYFDFDIWNNTNGKLILGLPPRNNTSLVYASTTSNSKFWEIKFDKIFFENKNKEKINYNDETIEFSFDSNVIIGTNEYKKYLEEIISELISGKICKSAEISAFYDEFNNVTRVYDYYYCNNNIETKNKLNELISPLYFYSNELNYTFEISKDQILKEKNDIIYINIFFSKTTNKWILGKPMIFKYKLIFNQNLGKIGILKKSNNEGDDKQNKSSENKENNGSNDIIFKHFIIIPLIIYLCAGVIIVVIQNYFNKKSDQDHLIDDYKDIDNAKKEEDKDNNIGIIDNDNKEEVKVIN
jgi:hypothetical protein